MLRICDACKCKKFRVKRVPVRYTVHSTAGHDFATETGTKARYMCPACRRLHKLHKLTAEELGLDQIRHSWGTFYE